MACNAGPMRRLTSLLVLKLEQRGAATRLLARRRQSDYASKAAQALVASNTIMSPEQSLYRESETRNLLSHFGGGHIHLEKDENSGIARLLIEHEGKKNAFSGSMILQLADHVAELSKWKDGRAVIIRGANGDFCTGADLNFVQKIATPVLGAKMSIFMGSVLAKLHQLPLITVAHVEGYALGGGAELLSACDFRAVSTTANIGFVHGRLGVSPGWGGGTHLTQLVGWRTALRLMASAQVLDANECLRLGLADFVFSNDSEVSAWFEQFTKTSAQSVRAAKRIVLNAQECDYSESLNRERDVFAELWGGQRHLQALQKLAGSK
uniref:Ethylmalonyl-CoA decarboxylase n=1 Tax=Plectus sambesii TaxID=2011161 RepID=A0A914USV6_9BILA